VNDFLGLAGTLAGAVALVLAGLFAARATRHAASATAQAQQAAAQVAAEPAQRQADLEAFKAIRLDMQEEVAELRTRTMSLTSLVRSFAVYVSALTGQMRLHGIEPPAPPDRVDEYNRTGV
jgi:ABC-type protease/lipase transport system fused ATPase/permease subunit